MYCWTYHNWPCHIPQVIRPLAWGPVPILHTCAQGPCWGPCAWCLVWDEVHRATCGEWPQGFALEVAPPLPRAVALHPPPCDIPHTTLDTHHMPCYCKVLWDASLCRLSGRLLKDRATARRAARNRSSRWPTGAANRSDMYSRMLSWKSYAGYWNSKTQEAYDETLGWQFTTGTNSWRCPSFSANLNFRHKLWTVVCLLGWSGSRQRPLTLSETLCAKRSAPPIAFEQLWRYWIAAGTSRLRNDSRLLPTQSRLFGNLTSFLATNLVRPPPPEEDLWP